jgi:phage FluMu protein Com
MDKIFCPECNKTLFIAQFFGLVQIKCPRCGAVINIESKDQSVKHTSATVVKPGRVIKR